MQGGQRASQTCEDRRTGVCRERHTDRREQRRRLRHVQRRADKRNVQDRQTGCSEASLGIRVGDSCHGHWEGQTSLAGPPAPSCLAVSSRVFGNVS